VRIDLDGSCFDASNCPYKAVHSRFRAATSHQSVSNFPSLCSELKGGDAAQVSGDRPWRVKRQTDLSVVCERERERERESR
jgi:hypothetical protein